MNAVRSGFVYHPDPACAPSIAAPGVADLTTYDAVTKQYAPARTPGIAACPGGPAADVCVTFTPQFSDNGAWIAPPAPARDPKRCANGSPAYQQHACARFIHHYAVAATGSRAKAGDVCWGSPGSIGAFLGAHVPYEHVFDIVELVYDTAYDTSNVGYAPFGWIYSDRNGKQWFQGAPGARAGVSAGAIAFGVSSANAVTSIDTIPGDIFSIFNDVPIAVRHWTRIGVVHTRGCFTHGWNGAPPA